MDHFCPFVAIPTDTRLPAEWCIAALAWPPSNTESAMLECFLTTEWSLFEDKRLLVFSPDAKDSVSISDLHLFSSVSASDLSISPSILSANDLESWSLPLTDGLPSRICPQRVSQLRWCSRSRCSPVWWPTFCWTICWAIILTPCYHFENCIVVKE